MSPIGTERTSRDVSYESVIRGKAEVVRTSAKVRG
jgi:hypothetical protein